MTKHYLNFISTGRGLMEIDEPEGFDQAIFDIEQEEGRHGRDVFLLSNGDGKLRLTGQGSNMDHKFDYVIEAYERDGFEAEVKYIVEFDGVQNVVGEISFQSISTDKVTYVELTVVEENFKTLFKKRFDVKTNLFSDKTLDDADIEPVTTYKALAKAKPVLRVSEWRTPAGVGNVPIVAGLGGTGNPIFANFNFANATVNSDIQDSLNYIGGIQPANLFGYIEAQDNLQDVKIDITNLTFTVQGNGFGRSFFRLKYFIGTDDELTDGFIQGQSIIVETINDTEFYQETNASYTINIPAINRTQKLYIYFTTLTESDSNLNTYTLSVNVFSMDIKITATEVSYNSVIDIVQLIDAMRYNALSSANLPVSAPRWEFGGKLYSLFITSQSLMRGLTDEPFNISSKDIVEEYLRPIDADYQIQPDGTIFYGMGLGKGSTDSDFYRDYEILSLTQQDATDEFGQPLGQIEGFEVEVNKDFRVNEFKYGFKNFASQKEAEQENTKDIVHAGFETLLPNKRVENKKVVEVGFIFDPFMWEDARQKAFDLTENTATQNDDKIYCAEFVILTDADRQQTETIQVDHRATGTDNILQLVNNERFGWIRIGLYAGDTITLSTGGTNTGTYTVTDVTERILYLSAQGFNPQNIGIVNTTVNYSISPSVLWVNRTNEGFAEISNISDGDNYGNLPHTAKRNVLNYWNSYLATCCINKPGMPIKITDYNNNPDAYTRLETETEGIREGDDFIPTNPILTPNIVTLKAIISLQKVFDTQTKQKLHNGYVKAFDSTGLPLLGYIKSLSFIPQTRGGIDANDIIGEATIVLKEKYQEFYIEIFGNGNGMITLSNGESASDFTFRIENEKLFIFDETGKQMFVPVPFNRVKVGGNVQASTPEQLEQWLNLL